MHSASPVGCRLEPRLRQGIESILSATASELYCQAPGHLLTLVKFINLNECPNIGPHISRPTIKLELKVRVRRGGSDNGEVTVR